MTVVTPKPPSEYPRRGDRLNEEPSAKNAQGLFPPDACIFVGNLSTKVAVEQLGDDLEKLFDKFGTCYAKIKQGKKKDLPGAFVQFERVEDADKALACEEPLLLHDRPLRIEKAKGKRKPPVVPLSSMPQPEDLTKLGTAILGLRSGAAISENEVSLALGGRGPLETHCIESHFTQAHGWTGVCKVTFAYVDDCKDAIKFFSRDNTYYLRMLDMGSSPAPPSQRHSFPRTKSHDGPLSSRNGNGPGRWQGNRPHRGGYPHNRGGYRGFPKYRGPQYHQEIIPPRGGYPSPPIMFSGVPYAENHPPFYPPPPPPPPPPGHYGPPPFIVNGYPACSGPPMPPPPPAYAPVVSNGPFIVSSQPVYSPITPTYYGEQVHPDHGYFGPHPNMAGQPGHYYGHPDQAYYGQVYQQNQVYMTPPSSDDSTKAENGSVEETKEEVQAESKPEEKQAEEQKPEEEVDIFNLPDPEEPPRLIRVHDSDSESEADNEKEEKVPKAKRKPRKSSHRAPKLGTVKEEEGEEADDETTLEPASDSDSSPPNTNDRPKETPNSTEDGLKEDRPKRPSPDRVRSCSRGRSRNRKPLAAEYQPMTGTTIEEYVRKTYVQRAAEDPVNECNETLLQDVIEDLETERMKSVDKQTTEMWDALWERAETGSSACSRSVSVGRSSSSKSA